MIRFGPFMAALALAALATVEPTCAQQRQLSLGPLVLEKTGSFHAGGTMTVIDGKAAMAGHMYVEYMIPAKRTHSNPVIMIHGGLRSGTNFTGTLDDKEGWAQLFVRQGYAVYIVDQVGRGRSGLTEAQ